MLKCIGAAHLFGIFSKLCFSSSVSRVVSALKSSPNILLVLSVYVAMCCSFVLILVRRKMWSATWRLFVTSACSLIPVSVLFEQSAIYCFEWEVEIGMSIGCILDAPLRMSRRVLSSFVLCLLLLHLKFSVIFVYCYHAQRFPWYFVYLYNAWRFMVYLLCSLVQFTGVSAFCIAVYLASCHMLSYAWGCLGAVYLCEAFFPHAWIK